MLVVFFYVRSMMAMNSSFFKSTNFSIKFQFSLFITFAKDNTNSILTSYLPKLTRKNPTSCETCQLIKMSIGCQLY